MYQIGLSSCGKTLNKQLFEDYAKAGITAIEISPDWPEFKYLDYQALDTLAHRYGITLWSYHLPFQTVDLSTTDRAWRLCATEYLSEQIKRARDIGIRRFVAHPSSGGVSEAERAEKMACAKDSLNTLAEFAKHFDAEICVEDLPRRGLGYCSDEILDILSVNDDLRVCFDTNHLLEEDIPTFIRRVGNKIATLHVSDYDFVDERHWLPGEGKVQWSPLLAALKEVGYNGVWMYEIRFESNADQRGRNLTCEDFVANAKKLFAGDAL